jgi:hypothetical protein
LTGLVLVLGCSAAWAQQRLPARLGAGLEERAFPRFEPEYALPEVHRWYEPRHLFETYARPWYGVETRYAPDLYRRYVDLLLEGEEWYDGFGTSLGRGWLVYSWTQVQPGAQGSRIQKRPANPEQRSAYDSFFDRLVIATDGDRRSTYRLMVGDEIYTSFTPLTLYKPRFNGLRLDQASDLYEATLILARPSEPNRDGRTDVTHLMGGHLRWRVGDMARIGLTYVNAHNARTRADFTSGSPRRGVLTTRQNQALEDLWVSIRDDSPADGKGGPVVFAYDIVLTDTSGQRLRGSEIGLVPLVEGGRVEGSSLVADGAERIVLHYDLRTLEGVRSVDLERARVELSLANDYRIEMTSNLQTNGQPRGAEPVFLTFGRALGNVQDRSNGTVLGLDYTLPTANELLGVNWDLMDWKGLSFQGEVVLNRRYGQYPSPNIPHGYQAVEQDVALYGRSLYRRYPWTFFAEAFSIADAYATRFWLTEASGIIRYKDPVPRLYEFVDDDDDDDAMPDWERPFQPWNSAVWPSYDENGDFIFDHNQNRNQLPDYEEPFLRFRADRPEFLFGLDMNHNGAIDRFEDDEQPDYPYQHDQRGYNAYVQVNLGPEARLLGGRQSLGRMEGDGRTRAWYWLGLWTHLLGSGRLRLFEHGALVRDNIADDFNRWAQPAGAAGRMQQVVDPLPARHAWKNVLYADVEHGLGHGVRLLHRCKWEEWRQRDDPEQVRSRGGRVRSGFLGLINKAEWSIPVGLGSLEPRWKSEWRRERPFSARLASSTLVEQTALLIWTQPLLAESVGVSYFPRYGRQIFRTELQAGLELNWLRLLAGESEEAKEDFNGWTAVGQFTNRVGYLGYQVVARAGLRLGKRRFESGRTQRTSLFFLTINAGL